jgi:hypothetical protein
MANRTYEPRKFEMMFMGLNRLHMPKYPHWMHKDGAEPRLIENSLDDVKARADGYDNITAAAMSNRYLINWFWDLEDFSIRQLHVFAKEEYGVDLPIEAGQEKLFQAVCELTRNAPQNQNRLILMAHTVKMNYDATLEEIKRLFVNPGDANVENESFEVIM